MKTETREEVKMETTIQRCDYCSSETTQGKTLYGELLCPHCYAAENGQLEDDLDCADRFMDDQEQDTEDHLF